MLTGVGHKLIEAESYSANNHKGHTNFVIDFQLLGEEAVLCQGDT